MCIWIGFDIGGTKIAAQAVDHNGNVIWSDQRPTAKGDKLVPTICEVVELALLSVQETANNSLSGIGIAIPGHVTPETGEIHLAVNLNVDAPLPIGPMLKDRFDVAVKIDNDARVAAIGVQHLLALENVAFINIGTGMSAGMILNGDLYRGRNGLAGEIGHITLDHTDGRNLILENIVSGPGLVREAERVGYKVSNPAELFEIANTGSQVAQNVLNTFFYYLSRAIQWIALSMDIDQIVLGGGVTHASDLFETQLRSNIEQLRQRSQVTNLLLTSEKISLLPKSYNAGLWGATYLIRQNTTSEL